MHHMTTTHAGPTQRDRQTDERHGNSVTICFNKHTACKKQKNNTDFTVDFARWWHHAADTFLKWHVVNEHKPRYWRRKPAFSLAKIHLKPTTLRPTESLHCCRNHTICSAISNVHSATHGDRLQHVLYTSTLQGKVCTLVMADGGKPQFLLTTRHFYKIL